MNRHRHCAPALLAMVSCVAAVHGQSMPTFALDRPTWIAPEPFTAVTALRELPGGGVLIADFDDEAVFLVAPAGQSVRRIGRSGAGPNEYRTPRRLVPLPGDSTLLLDRDGHRYLIIDPLGRIVSTQQFPPSVGTDAEFVRGADRDGRIYFTEGFLPRSPGGSMVVIKRWDRRTGYVDSVASVMAPNPTPVTRTLPGGQKVVVRRLMPYSPQDDWVVAPSGRIALIRASPYRVDWREVDGRITTGVPVNYAAVRVTDADKKLREPNGPPFQLEYPATKPAFREGGVLVDDQDRVWVRRERAASAGQVTWDAFDGRGRHLGTMLLPVSKQIIGITSRFIYVVRTDEDDLRWVEAYAR